MKRSIFGIALLVLIFLGSALSNPQVIRITADRPQVVESFEPVASAPAATRAANVGESFQVTHCKITSANQFVDVIDQNGRADRIALFGFRVERQPVKLENITFLGVYLRSFAEGLRSAVNKPLQYLWEKNGIRKLPEY